MKRTIYLSSRPLIGAAIQPKAMTDDEQRELERLVGQMSGFVKMMMGVADNVALTVMKVLSPLWQGGGYKAGVETTTVNKNE